MWRCLFMLILYTSKPCTKCDSRNHQIAVFGYRKVEILMHSSILFCIGWLSEKIDRTLTGVKAKCSRTKKKKKKPYDKLIGKWLSINTFTKFSSTNAKHPPVTALSVWCFSVFCDKNQQKSVASRKCEWHFFSTFVNISWKTIWGWIDDKKNHAAALSGANSFRHESNQICRSA